VSKARSEVENLDDARVGDPRGGLGFLDHVADAGRKVMIGAVFGLLVTEALRLGGGAWLGVVLLDRYRLVLDLPAMRRLP
jgi:hypothetical protein